MATVEGGERECKINDAAGNWTQVNAYNACMSVRVRSSLPLLFSIRAPFPSPAVLPPRPMEAQAPFPRHSGKIRPRAPPCAGACPS